MIKYEFPLNERVRKFLRIEEIFNKIDDQLRFRLKFDDYVCFHLYFCTMASASRTDLKVELIQELEKQRLIMSKKNKTKKKYTCSKSIEKSKSGTRKK